MSVFAALEPGVGGADGLYAAYQLVQLGERRRNGERFDAFEPGLSGLPAPATELYHRFSALPKCLPTADPAKVADMTMTDAVKSYPGAPRASLPPPDDLEVSLSVALSSRRSTPAFAGDRITLDQLSCMLHWSSGTNDPTVRPPRRMAPSAGALYPLEMYVYAFAVDGVPPSLQHYDPRTHELEFIRESRGPIDLWPALAPGFRGTTPAAALILTASLDRLIIKYGERAYRFAHLEAGHVAQNVLLTAAALNLSARPVGGFVDAEIARMLSLVTRREVGVYLVLLDGVNPT